MSANSAASLPLPPFEPEAAPPPPAAPEDLAWDDPARWQALSEHLFGGETPSAGE